MGCLTIIAILIGFIIASILFAIGGWVVFCIAIGAIIILYLLLFFLGIFRKLFVTAMEWEWFRNLVNFFSEICDRIWSFFITVLDKTLSIINSILDFFVMIWNGFLSVLDTILYYIASALKFICDLPGDILHWLWS